MPKKLTTEEFIEKARRTHGDKYDYSKVDYVNSVTKVCIVCPTHGEFWQNPKSHLRGLGCKKCSINAVKDTETFIEEAKKIHGEKYDYSKTKYVNNCTKVCIVCPEHGEFWQRPHGHIILKHGCPKCGIILNGKIHNKTTEYFIKKAEEVHGKRYDYSKTKYTKRSNDVIITCPVHGDFAQRAGNHLNGYGCPKCSISRLEEKMMKALEMNNIKYEYEKGFDWLKKDGKMTIDFYLPEYNTAIECQGEQHYQPVEYFGGIDEFKKDRERDKTKKNLLNEHKIHLIYYADIKYDKDVFIDPEKIIETLKKIK